MRKRIALLMLVAAVVGCVRAPAAPPSSALAVAPSAQGAPKEAPNRADWRPIPLPEGYTAVAAMGDALVLEQLGAARQLGHWATHSRIAGSIRSSSKRAQRRSSGGSPLPIIMWRGIDRV